MHVHIVNFQASYYSTIVIQYLLFEILAGYEQVNMDEPVKAFLLLSALLSALSSSTKLLRRLRIRYISNRRRRRLILLRLAFIRRCKRNNLDNIPVRRSWSWHRPQYFFDELQAGNLPDDMWKEHLRANARWNQANTNIGGHGQKLDFVHIWSKGGKYLPNKCTDVRFSKTR